MDQQADLFSQKRTEIMVEMATKKLQSEINSLKEIIQSLHSEVSSLKSQVGRMQFAQPASYQKPAYVQSVAETQTETPQMQFPQFQSQPQQQFSQPLVQQAQKNVPIVDCRPTEDRKQEFVSGAAKNSEPVRPRFGDYKSEDVSIDKFFYFGRK